MSSVINIPPAAGQNAQLPEADSEPAPAPPGEARAQVERATGYGYRSRSQSASRTAPVVRGPSSPFLPMLLSGLALLGWLGFQAYQLVNERQGLQAAYASQQQTVDNASKLRASLDALAADTQRLADGGNPNAKLLVDELRKRGITINTSATSTAPATTR